MSSYSNCPCCGILCDDGTIVKYENKLFLVCFDCSDKMTSEEIIRTITKNRKGKND